jgi:ABC-type transport system involved in cytochrome c biogenesis permease subunit
VVFPLVFLLTVVAATGQQPFVIASYAMARGWLFSHIALVLAGYACLFLSFSASVLYLIQEHNLKAKTSGGLLSRLPALQVLDELGYRALLLGFPCMTVGLILGMVMAEVTFHDINYLDPKIFLSLLTWAVYLLLVYTRWNAGWRGRKAAYLAAGAFATAIIAWAANYFSTIHRFVRS